VRHNIVQLAPIATLEESARESAWKQKLKSSKRKRRKVEMFEIKHGLDFDE
jgi:hypothetical protein